MLRTTSLKNTWLDLMPQNAINSPDLWSGPRIPLFFGDRKKTIFFPPARFNPSHEKVSEPLKRIFCLAADRINGRNIEVWRGGRGKEGGLLMRKGKRVELVGKEDEWATSYDDKLGRSLADVRAICASTARDNTEPIDDTGWRYRSLVGCHWWTCPFYLSERYVALLRYHVLPMIARDFSLDPFILIP